jgi:amino acid transporter
MLVGIPGAMAALTTAFLIYLGYFVAVPVWAEKAIGIAVLLGLAFVNTRGVKQGAGVQNLFTVLKVTGLLALVVLAVATQRGDAANFLPLAPASFSTGLLTAIGVAMISTLFAYDGWHFVGFVAGEIRDPGRNVARSILIGVFVVIVAYVAANLAYIFVLGPDGIAASNRVATDAMTAMIGPFGGTLMTLAILCSIFGAISANVLAGPRVFFAMARDGRLFPALAAVHPRFETPARAIWALAGWAGLLTLTGGFEHLITMSQFANWIFFTMVVLSVVILRRTRPDAPRPYRVTGYPWTVIVFVAVSSVFVINTLVEAPASSLLGLTLLLLGIPFYFRNRGASPPRTP